MKLIRSSMLASIVASSVLATGTAMAADPAGDAAKAQFEKEKARCMSGTTGQEQSSCLRSAGAAYDEARRGTLANPNTNFDQNAMNRCASLPQSDRLACEQRVTMGVPRSAVKAGGDVKETVEITTGAPR